MRKSWSSVDGSPARQSDIFQKNVCAVAARLRRNTFENPVNAFFHRLSNRPLLSRATNRPNRCPNHLDDVQPAPPKKPFRVLNDFSIAANRTVEPLQIAVDDPNQIIEIFARAERDGTERSGSSHSPSRGTPRTFGSVFQLVSPRTANND